MSQYLFLYRGAQRPTAPQETQQIMQKWMAWFQELGKQGYIKDPGQPLEPTGKIVSGKQKTVTDGPFAEAKDIGEAAEISKGCPIFDRNGFVEVRPVMKM